MNGFLGKALGLGKFALGFIGGGSPVAGGIYGVLALIAASAVGFHFYQVSELRGDLVVEQRDHQADLKQLDAAHQERDAAKANAARLEDGLADQNERIRQIQEDCRAKTDEASATALRILAAAQRDTRPTRTAEEFDAWWAQGFGH